MEMIDQSLLSTAGQSTDPEQRATENIAHTLTHTHKSPYLVTTSSRSPLVSVWGFSARLFGPVASQRVRAIPTPYQPVSQNENECEND